MGYIYHLMPEPFIGTSLIPLNEMDKNSDLYRRHASKYLGREELTKQVIPILNCKWNDVVQFSAINPQIILNELRSIHPNLGVQKLKCFKVFVKDIEKTYEGVVFNRAKQKIKGDFAIKSEEVEPLSSQTYTELDSIPIETIKFWNEVKRNEGKLLWFAYIPHIFLKGPVNTSNFEIIDLK